MKFMTTKSALLAFTMNNPIPNRSTLPILETVMIDCSNGAVSLTGSGLDIFATVNIGQSSGVLSQCVPVKTLKSAVSSFSNGEIEVECTDKNMILTQGALSIPVSWFARENAVGDFPKFDLPDVTHTITTDPASLLDAFECVHRSQSTEVTRYYLNGTFLQSHEGKMRLVSTDGHRLSLFDSEIDCPDIEEKDGIIIPIDTVKMVMKALKTAIKNKIETVAIDICGPSRMSFHIGRSFIKSKTVDGQFPDYARVMPRGNRSRLLVTSTPAFALAMEPHMARHKATRNKSMSIRFNLKTSGVSLYSNSPDAGGDLETKAGLDDIAWSGPDLDVAYNGSYLKDALAAIGLTKKRGPAILIEIEDAVSPIRITGGKPGLTQVLMPLRY